LKSSRDVKVIHRTWWRPLFKNRSLYDCVFKIHDIFLHVLPKLFSVDSILQVTYPL